MTDQKPLIDKYVLILLGLALVIRLLTIRVMFWGTEAHADDAFSYIFLTYHSQYLGVPEDSHLGAFATSIAPLYPIYLIPFFKWMAASLPVVGGYPYLPIFEAGSYQAARIGHVFLDTGTVLSVYVLATTIFDRTVGRVALIAQAFDPRALIANGPIATEPLFLVLFTAGLAFFALGTTRDEWRYYPAAVMIGLSIMTRPVPIAFPLILGAYLVWRSEYRQLALRLAAAMVGIMLLIIIPWNIRTGLGGKSFFLPVSDSAFFHLWATTLDDSYSLGLQADVNRAHMDTFGRTDDIRPRDYVQSSVQQIVAAPIPWLAGILGDTISAFIRPYGANIAMPRGAPSLLGTLVDFTRGEASLAELIALPALPRRILLYLWHSWSLVLGTVGVVLAIVNRKPLSFIVLSWVIYASVLVSVLLIEPRYVYPVLFGFNIFAAYACVELLRLLQRLNRKKLVEQATLREGIAK